MNRRTSHACLRWFTFALLLGSACATGPRWRGSRDGSPAAHEGWAHLIAGDTTSAEKRFSDALTGASDDIFARFGRATLAFEHGQTATALDEVQALLRAAAAKDASPWARALATAASGWLSTLVYEDQAWRQRLETLSRLPGRHLPWLARTEIIQVTEDLARRAGRPELVHAVSESAHCPRQAELVGSAGRRPVFDLLEPFGAAKNTHATISVVGCRAQVHAPDGLPGVLVVHTTLEVPAKGAFDVVLDHRGLSALRIDGGDWHRHGDALAWGPHRSAMRVELTAGSHRVEVRLASYGGGAEYWLAALPADAPPFALPKPSNDSTTAAAIDSYVKVLLAGIEGRWNRGLRAFDGLRALPRFAPGLVQAGRLVEADPSRPDNVLRDLARNLWLLAVEQDPKLVRARLALSALESMEGRSREASAQALAARTHAPTWWPAALAAYEGLSAEGLEALADEALDAGLQLTKSSRPEQAWACPLLDAATRRARQREALPQVEAYLRLQLQCEARDLGMASRAYERGEAARAAAAFARAARLSSAPQWLVGDRAAALAAANDLAGAQALVERARAAWPRDTGFVLRFANLQALANKPDEARQTIAEGLRTFPAAADLRQAARALGVALPIDHERIDGLGVIAGFMKEGRRYDAPAVFVLDRLVERVFADGTRMLLTHNIVKVQSKDALDRWGEVTVPAGAEVLTLRTVKPDLSVREPEDIFGKESVSAPELEPGDFVEWETLETQEPSPAFAPGFLSQRFYFQSNEAPLDRSEYVIVHPDDVAIDVDRRSGAPEGKKETLGDGLGLLRFTAQNIPQIFPERAAVAPLHWLPSVRASASVSTTGWTRFLADRLSTIARQTPAVADVARTVLKSAGGDAADARARAKAIVTWVTQNIESDGGVDEPATYALARGRGNRLAVALALAKELDLAAEPVLVRPLGVAGADEAPVPSELMSFSDVLLYFPKVPGAGKHAGVFVDLRVRYAPFGYVPPQLDGALALRLPEGEPILTSSHVADRRRVELRIAVGADGGATVWGQERLSGGPAADWAEALKQIGADEDKRRRRFEEAYLAFHFPGASLQALRFDVQSEGVRLDYKLHIDRFATSGAAGMAVEPRFFMAQPGRRFATESQRSTTLLMGPDVPLDLTAAIEWPAGFAVVDPGDGLISEPLGALGPRFVERRTVESDGGGGRPARVVIRRETRVPLVRIPPARYPAVSAALRRVDVAEQAVIRVRKAAAPQALLQESPTR